MGSDGYQDSIRPQVAEGQELVRLRAENRRLKDNLADEQMMASESFCEIQMVLRVTCDDLKREKAENARLREALVSCEKGLAERDAATKPQMRMNAYYYGFDSTGNLAIDRILSAVACAGKAFHHTDSWTDEAYDGTAPEPHRGKTPVEWIQNAANDAAEKLRAEDARLSDELVTSQKILNSFHAELLEEKRLWRKHYARAEAAEARVKQLEQAASDFAFERELADHD